MDIVWNSKILIWIFIINRTSFSQDTVKHGELNCAENPVESNYALRNTIDQYYSEPIARLQQKISELQETVTLLSNQLQTLNHCCAGNANIPHNCRDIQHQGYHDSGIYTIFSRALGDWIRVYCDMESDGGGWLVIQRRRDGSVDFDRTWDEYRDGFGTLPREHWLGNKALHAITSDMTYTLRIDLQDWSGEIRHSLYSNFTISDETNHFKLTFEDYIGGEAGDALGRNGKQNNSYFSTKDRDNDKMADYNCAEHDNGFWYSDCAYGSLNGPYCFGGLPYGSIIWNTEGNMWHQLHYCYRLTEMKIRPGT